MPLDRHPGVCSTLLICRLIRSLDHAVRLVGATYPIQNTSLQPPADGPSAPSSAPHLVVKLWEARGESDDDEPGLKLPAALHCAPSFAVMLWEVILRGGSCSAGLGSPVGRADGGGRRQVAAEVQVAAAKELCGVLVSHAKLVGALSERVLSGSAALQSPLAAACREARDGAREKVQVQGGNGCGGLGDAVLVGGGCSIGETGSTADGQGKGCGPEGSGGSEAGSGGGESGDKGGGSGGSSESRVAAELVSAASKLYSVMHYAHEHLRLLVDTNWVPWALSVLTGKPRQGAAAWRGAAVAAADPAALAVLRGAVSQHASAVCGAALAQLVGHRVLRAALYGKETVELIEGCSSGAYGEDARLQGKAMAATREAFEEQEASALGWAMQALALLLPALTLTRGSAAHVPRGWRSALDVRVALGTCCAAAGMAKRRADDTAWAAAAGLGGESEVWLREMGEARRLRFGCCAVLDCMLRLAVREDTAGQLVAWAQEAVGRAGGAGLRRQGEAVAVPVEAAEVGAVAAAAVGCDAFGTAEWGEEQLGMIEAVGVLQGALASLRLPREVELAARLAAAVAAAGAAGVLAAGAAVLLPARPDLDVGSDGRDAEGLSHDTGRCASGAGGADAAVGQGVEAEEREEQQQQQQQQQEQQQKRGGAVDAFRRQARELLAAFSALPSYPYTALGLHKPSSNGGSSPLVQLGRGGRSKKCGKGSSKAGGGGGGGAQRQEADEAPLPVTVLPRVCSNPLCVSFEGSCEQDLWLRKCGGCLAVRYCSRGCQAAHWGAGHRAECRELREAVLDEQ